MSTWRGFQAIRQAVRAIGWATWAGAVAADPSPKIFPEPPAEPHPRVALAARQSADPTLLRLAAAVFDPLRHGLPDFAGHLPEGPRLRPVVEGAATYHLVQFARDIDAAVRREVLRSGFEIVGYVPNRALLVRYPQAGLASAPPPPAGARYFGEFHAGYKLAPDLYRRTLRRSGPANESGSLSLDVWLLPGEDPDPLALAVRQHFPAARVGHVKRSTPSRLRVNVPQDETNRLVGALIRDRAVRFLEEHRPLELHNDAAVWIGQSYDRGVGPTEAADPDPKPYQVSAPIWNRGLLGEGQIVAVGDTGLEYDNCQFRDPVHAVVPQSVAPPGLLTVDPGHRKVVAYNAPGANGSTTDDSYRHGTHTAGSVAGDALTHLAAAGSSGHDAGDGMAPRARIVFEDLSTKVSSVCSTNIAVGSIEDLLRQEYAAGARISSNSWGSLAGADPASFEIDSTAADLEDMLVVFSAGNNGAGGLSGQAQCKNCLVVGASENYDGSFVDAFGILDPENMTAFSSRGPTADGRIKPDVVAPGYTVRSARFPVQYFSDPGNPACNPASPDVCFPSFGGCYVTDTSQDCHVGPLLGTSMSAPVTAGLAALAREYFVKGFHPKGEADPGDARNPSGALLKAILINSARSLAGHLYERRGQAVDLGLLTEAPSDEQGWGRVTLDDALFFAGDDRRLHVVDLSHAAGLATDEAVEVDFTTSTGNEILKLTLVWSDAPAEPFASGALVNDLDLLLEGPAGVVYRGNQWTSDAVEVLGDRVSLPDAVGKDTLNNVESIWLPAPAGGLYTARVVGADVPGGAQFATQGFALVVAGGFEPCTIVAPPTGFVIETTSPTGIGLAWEAVPGAVGYEIFHNATACSEPMAYDRKIEVPSSETSHVDAIAAPGTAHHYTVRAVMSAEGCRTVDSACVSGRAVPVGPAPVPDGTFGQALTASRASESGSVLDLQWDVLSCPAPGYHLLWGDLANVATQVVLGAECGLAGGSHTWAGAPPGDSWFLVVSDDAATVEGSWGVGANGAPRGGGSVSGVCGLTVRQEGGVCP